MWRFDRFEVYLLQQVTWSHWVTEWWIKCILNEMFNFAGKDSSSLRSGINLRKPMISSNWLFNKASSNFIESLIVLRQNMNQRIPNGCQCCPYTGDLQLIWERGQLPYILNSKTLDRLTFQKFHHISTLVVWVTWLFPSALQPWSLAISSHYCRNKSIDA